jgi:hypothetical protein
MRDQEMMATISADVLIISLLATMPLGVMAGTQLIKRLPESLAAFIGPAILGLVVTIVVVLDSATGHQGNAANGYPVTSIGDSAAMRCVLAIMLWVGSLSTAVCAFKATLAPFISQIAAQSTSLAFLAAAVSATLLPSVFIQVKCQHAWRRFDELVDSSRIGEARDELLVVLRLSPHSNWQGRSVTEAFQRVQAEYDGVEQSLSQLPHPPSDTQTALQQARLLAILGKTDLALTYLEELPGDSQSIDVPLLRATILETQQAWNKATAEYLSARKLLLDSGESYKMSSQWLTALRGEAFCRRKAGDLSGAEKAYLQLVQASPTSDHAMLLAYFYEDTQQTSSAREWIREAIRIDPAVEAEARPLWAKLETNHFGCFQAYRDPSKPKVRSPDSLKNAD